MNKANATLTLLNSSEDFSNIQASYFWDGVPYGQSDTAALSNFEWWQFGPIPFTPTNITFAFNHRPAPYSTDYEYTPNIATVNLPGNLSNPGSSAMLSFFDGVSTQTVEPNTTTTFASNCEPHLVIKPEDFCKDTFTFGYKPSADGTGNIFDVTGQRESNVPEPLTMLGSGLAIAIGAVLKRRFKSTVS